MNLMSRTSTLSMDKFNKCGELYRSPIINDKQYMFLSCIHCKDISWELETFLQHLDNTHSTIDEICSNLSKEENIVEEYTNSAEVGAAYSSTNTILLSKYENDPLDEEHYNFNEVLPPQAIKTEKAELNECADVNPSTEDEIFTKDTSEINKIFNINYFKCGRDNSTDEDYAPHKISTEDENDDDTTGEYLNEEYDQDDVDNIVPNDVVKDHCNEKRSLKGFSKNRDFIKAIIVAYQKQNVLWDRSYKTERSATAEKQEALAEILSDISHKFKISARPQQIECIIKRLKLKFIHNLRLRRDKGEPYKPLWYFELLKFLEPHLKENKMKSCVCKQLNDNQLIALIKFLKENECFWNENNIYHTSIINKQEILKAVTRDFATICDLKDFNVAIMQNAIDEIIQMAREENSNKMIHMESAKNGDAYKSRNKYYKEIQFLLAHVGPFKCKYCLKKFNDIYAYKFHISRHDGIKPFKCMQCPRELTHKKEFVCHLRRHTKECPFQCNVCEKSFPSQKEWHRHVIKHGSKPYVCELCADSFYTQHQLTNHMKNHNNIRDHVCSECGKGFTHRGLLRQHLQTHNKTKCFCTLCDNIYSNPRSLRKHYVRVHESEQQLSTASKTQYNCQICKITFSSIQDAKKHRKEHKQSNPAERKHVCDICGHHFAYPRNLADHKKTHSNIRDQVCDVCGKAFTNANLLNQHKNVHTDKKFVCKACGKDYAHYRGLCRHISKVHGTNIRDLEAMLEKQNLPSAVP